MAAISANLIPEDLIDVASVRILDLRTLAQDEIRCLTHICGDVPARLQDLVNVIVDKSIFNESAGGRRQTYDRDRLPRNKERRLSSNSVSTQLHLSNESPGHSCKDLIIHLCRQLKISEKGDRAMYQLQAVQPSGVVAEGNRSMSLKRMARASASLLGRAEGVVAPLSKAAPEVLVNGKELGSEVLHRSNKKMKTKEEARRKAAESQAGNSESHEDQEASLGHDEPVPLEDISAGGMPSAQIRNDLRSPDAGRAAANSHSVEFSEPSNAGESLLGRPFKMAKILCSTCEGSFSTVYSLRRHTRATGHFFDTKLLKAGTVHKKKKVVWSKSSLRCSCGNTYATVYTLRRHAVKEGHSFDLTQATTAAVDQDRKAVKGDEIDDDNADLKPGKRKLALLSVKSDIRRFTCVPCHRHFGRNTHLVRHMSTHFHKSTVKSLKASHRLPGAQLSGTSGVKVRLGRPPKLNRDVDIKQGKARQGRRGEPASLDGQVRPPSRKAEQSSLQTARNTPENAQNFTCQECGKVYYEHARYTGHLSSHVRASRKRKNEPASLDRQVKSQPRKVDESPPPPVNSTPEKALEKAPEKAPEKSHNVHNEFARYAGHLSMHARLRRAVLSETSTPGRAIVEKNMLNVQEVSAVGFRKLLNDKTGTYLSGLPAKLLFTESNLANK